MSDTLAELLATDPLAQAEAITGKSYKDDESTMMLGFLLNLDHNEAKNRALKEGRDSYHSMDLADTFALYYELGFEVVLHDVFEGRGYEGQSVPETYSVLWHPDGILASVESYQTTGRNSTKIYYNFAFDADVESRWSYTSSGHFFYVNPDGDVRVWVGDHDAREALRYTLNRFRSAGRFLSTWVESPFMYLVTYVECREVEQESWQARQDRLTEITAERISRLPERVQRAIRP